jgi:holo-[acyl-carrier protein] synthase
MIGTDIVDIKDLKKILNSKYREAFLKKVYTQRELTYCKGDIYHLATTFAAKEAVFKASGNKFFDPKKIEVLRSSSGKPYINGKEIFISLSYTKSYAVAFALLSKP